MTPLEMLGIFVGIPLGVFLVVVLAVSVPSWPRDGRYRPGVAWEAGPEWFNGPGEPHAGAPYAGPVGGAGGSW